MSQTLRQVEIEAQRRVNEPGDKCPRIIFKNIRGCYGVCLISDWKDTPIEYDAVSIVWPDKIETF